MNAGSVVPAAAPAGQAQDSGGENEMMSLLPAVSPRPREAMDTKTEALCQKGQSPSSMSALTAVSRLPPPLGAAALPLLAPPLAPLPPPFGTNWMSSTATSVEWPFLPSLPSQSRKDSLPKTMTVYRRSTPFQERTPDHRCSGGVGWIGRGGRSRPFC